MKRLVLTGYDDRMAKVGLRTSASMRAYCGRHGLQFECVRSFAAGSHPSWQKLQLLLDRLPEFHEILWLDADTLITNQETNIFANCSTLPWPLIVSRDWGEASPAKWPTHFSMGNFLVRRAAIEMLAVAQGREEWKNQMFWEQSAIQALAAEDPKKWRVMVLRRRALNAVPLELRPAPDPWQPGDFLAHLTSESNDARLAWINQYDSERNPGIQRP